jgi:DNA replication protein DnaC
VLTKDGVHLTEAFQRYWQSNIPVDYWFRDMNEFKGDKSLVKRYQEIVKDIEKTYTEGVRVCFAGKHGSGKSMVCSCILKRVVEQGKYTALYVNLTDIINVMTSPNGDRDESRRLLLETDFLVIDEVDQRFMGTENAADLFGRILEPVIRTRIQNRMPVFFCTNSPNVTDSFTGSLKASFSSLMHMVQLHAIMPGKDFRTDEKGSK